MQWPYAVDFRRTDIKWPSEKSCNHLHCMYYAQSCFFGDEEPALYMPTETQCHANLALYIVLFVCPAATLYNILHVQHHLKYHVKVIPS